MAANTHRILICLTPPPSARLAATLTTAGPPDTVRIVSTARQLADAAADNWPHTIVTDTVTAHTMSALLTRLTGRYAVVTIAATGHHTLHAVITGLLTEPASRPARQPPQLTGRQLQVTGMVCDGKTNQQIAVALGIELDTVKTHITNTFRLFGATSRAHLAALAVATGLVRIR